MRCIRGWAFYFFWRGRRIELGWMGGMDEEGRRVEEVETVEWRVGKVSKDEVRNAWKRMKNGKALGSDDIPVEVW